MIPLSHRDKRNLSSRIKEKLNGWKRLVFADRNSRNLFLFLILNLSFAFVELLYGVWTNSLGESYLGQVGISFILWLATGLRLICIRNENSESGESTAVR